MLNIKQLCSLLIFGLIPSHLLCQMDHASAFQDKVGIRIAVDTLISENSHLELFDSQMIISGLAFSGNISLHSDSSLVRIILVDTDYNEYLIYEAYPILSGSRQFSVNELGEETMLLDLLTPYRIGIELVDASVYLKDFLISQEDTYQAAKKGALILQQSKSKIDRINQNLQHHGQTWVAGETSISRLSYQEKKSLFGGRVPNFQGFEYYVGGVFVLPGALIEGLATKSAPPDDRTKEDAKYPEEFSWRDRHGSDWVTKVKNQTPCNSCYAFGSAAATELLINLYFNRHLDYDLSEQNIVSCIAGSCKKTGSPNESLDLITNAGVVMEDCFPYSAFDLDCWDVCSNPTERINITNWEFYHKEKDFKREIIAGAVAAKVFSWHHFMQIIGYKVIETGDRLYYRRYDDASYITVEQNSPLIGQTAWLCKNSWGESWGCNGFAYFVADLANVSLYALKGPVGSMILNESDIRCTDQDGDGYYFWGIGSKPAHCPDCPDEPDGDDSDPCIAHSDEFGNLNYITPTPEVKDSIILKGSPADLYISGDRIRWYEDKKLQNLVHEGELFPTGHTVPGNYTYYATQEMDGCESKAVDISLSILVEIPRPTGHDTVINIRESALLTVEGEPDATFNWYEDPLLTLLSGAGRSFEALKTDTGTYTYYVTQSLGSLESKPDTVLLTLVNINPVPDTAFLHVLIDKGVDTNGDSLISNNEAEAIISLDVSNNGIVDMTGIEAFVHLETLICSDNWIKRLDVSHNPALAKLNCSHNQLGSLNVSNNPVLSQLNCSNNHLYRLDVSNNPDLSQLNCSINLLLDLKVSHNPALTQLICNNNLRLWALDLSNNPELTQLNCNYNRLTRLDVTENSKLFHLECRGNSIYSLDLATGTSLSYLDCSFNKLSTLEVSNNTALRIFYCNDNNLTSLDISTNNSIYYLDIRMMSSLKDVCVWEMPFPPFEVNISKSGSPNVEFNVCSNATVPTNKLEFSIYPNPTYNLLTLETELPTHYSIDIYSVSGELIHIEEIEGASHVIDLSSFQKGVYFITIRSKDFVTTRKIIKL